MDIVRQQGLPVAQRAVGGQVSRALAGMASELLMDAGKEYLRGSMRNRGRKRGRAVATTKKRGSVSTSTKSGPPVAYSRVIRGRSGS